MARPAARPWHSGFVLLLSAALCAFTLAEVNYPQLGPLSQIAVFMALGLPDRPDDDVAGRRAAL